MRPPEWRVLRWPESGKLSECYESFNSLAIVSMMVVVTRIKSNSSFLCSMGNGRSYGLSLTFLSVRRELFGWLLMMDDGIDV